MGLLEGPLGGLLVRQGSVPEPDSRQRKRFFLRPRCWARAKRVLVSVAQGIVAFAGELAVSLDSEGRSCGSRDFDQSCRVLLADHFGAIPKS